MACREEHDDWVVESCAREHLVAVLERARRIAWIGYLLPTQCTSVEVAKKEVVLPGQEGYEEIASNEEIAEMLDWACRTRDGISDFHNAIMRSSIIVAREVFNEYLGLTKNKHARRRRDEETYEQSGLRHLGDELRNIMAHTATGTHFPVKNNHDFPFITLKAGDPHPEVPGGCVIGYLKACIRLVKTEFAGE